MIYHDNFHKSSLLFGHRSVGGCYMMPIGFSNERRYSASADSPISLTPAGMYSAEVLDHIVPDIGKGALEGLMSTDPYGLPIRIFLDPIGFMADYPAASSVLDFKYHTADAPCTLCSFTRNKNIVGADYAYTTAVTSRRMGTARYMEISHAIRHTGMKDVSSKYMGVREGGAQILQNSPLFMLYEGLKSGRAKTARNANGVHVGSPYLDTYLCSPVATDHALMGLSKNVLTLFLKLLREDLRQQVDIEVYAYVNAM